MLASPSSISRPLNSESKVDALVPENWVQCDDCGKWRRVTLEYLQSLEDDKPWSCSLNPNQAFASCDVGQELTEEDVDLGQLPGSVVGLYPSRRSGQLPAVWQLTEANIYEHRRRKRHHDDDIMVCQCLPTWRKGVACGCGPNCINRLLWIECTQGFCPCDLYCSNQKFARREYAKLDVRRAGAKGFGLFAAEDLCSGQFIIEYVGEVLEEEEYIRRRDYYHQAGQRHYYFMNIGNGEVIDACRKGNLARFINHSCEPNCETQKWLVGGELAIGLFALRDVAAGEELTFDYNFERYGDKPIRCYCGSPSCRKIIGGNQEVAMDSAVAVDPEDASRDLAPIMVTETELDREIRAILDLHVGLHTPGACWEERLVSRVKALCSRQGLTWKRKEGDMLSTNIATSEEPIPYAANRIGANGAEAMSRKDACQVSVSSDDEDGAEQEQKEAFSDREVDDWDRYAVQLDEEEEQTLGASSSEMSQRSASHGRDIAKPESSDGAGSGGGSSPSCRTPPYCQHGPTHLVNRVRDQHGHHQLSTRDNEDCLPENYLVLPRLNRSPLSVLKESIGMTKKVTEGHHEQAGAREVAKVVCDVHVQHHGSSAEVPGLDLPLELVKTGDTAHSSPSHVPDVSVIPQLGLQPQADPNSMADDESSPERSGGRFVDPTAPRQSPADATRCRPQEELITDAFGTDPDSSGVGISARSISEWGCLVTKDLSGVAPVSPSFVPRRRSEVERRVELLVDPWGRLRDPSRRCIVEVLRMFNLCDVGPLGRVCQGDSNQKKYLENEAGGVPQCPSSGGRKSGNMSVRPMLLPTVLADTAAVEAKARPSVPPEGPTSTLLKGVKHRITPRQRARIMDLSLLLDVVLKSHLPSVRKEFVACGLLHQLAAMVGQNVGSKEFGVVLRKVLRVVEMLPLSARDVHAPLSVHGTFANMLRSMSIRAVDAEVRRGALRLLKKFPLLQPRVLQATAGGGLETVRGGVHMQKVTQRQVAPPCPSATDLSRELNDQHSMSKMAPPPHLEAAAGPGRLPAVSLPYVDPQRLPPPGHLTWPDTNCLAYPSKLTQGGMKATGHILGAVQEAPRRPPKFRSASVHRCRRPICPSFWSLHAKPCPQLNTIPTSRPWPCSTERTEQSHFPLQGGSRSRWFLPPNDASRRGGHPWVTVGPKRLKVCGAPPGVLEQPRREGEVSRMKSRGIQESTSGHKVAAVWVHPQQQSIRPLAGRQWKGSPLQSDQRPSREQTRDGIVGVSETNLRLVSSRIMLLEDLFACGVYGGVYGGQSTSTGAPTGSPWHVGSGSPLHQDYGPRSRDHRVLFHGDWPTHAVDHKQSLSVEATGTADSLGAKLMGPNTAQLREAGPPALHWAQLAGYQGTPVAYPSLDPGGASPQQDKGAPSLQEHMAAISSSTSTQLCSLWLSDGNPPDPGRPRRNVLQLVGAKESPQELPRPVAAISSPPCSASSCPSATPTDLVHTALGLPQLELMGEDPGGGEAVTSIHCGAAASSHTVSTSRPEGLVLLSGATPGGRGPGSEVLGAGHPPKNHQLAVQDSSREIEEFVMHTVKHRVGKYVQPDHPNRVPKEVASELYKKICKQIIRGEKAAHTLGGRQKINRQKLEGKIKDFVRESVKRYHLLQMKGHEADGGVP